MEERYIAAIDLGTSKIAISVARVEGDDVQMLYYNESPSAGIRNSYILNPQKVSAPLKEIINKAEADLGIKILQVVVGLPRYAVKQEKATGSIPRTDTNASISQEEVDNLKNMALDNYPLDDNDKEVIYGAVAQSFTTEDFHQAVEDDVVGMVSESLEGNFKVFVGKRKSVTNIDKVFNDTGIAIARKYFVPDAMANMVLTGEEMDSGVAMIDFGAGVTSVSVYQRGILRHYAAIPFGGATITNDIKLEGGFSTTLAENIKLAFGACMPDKLASMSEKIIRIDYPDSGAEKQLPVRYLSEIITSREEEIIDAILYEIEQSGCSYDLHSGLVITGGGANLTNLANFVKERSGYNVRVGYPLRKFSSTGCSGVCETSATACAGMIMAAKNDPFINCLEEAPALAGQKTAEDDGAAEESIETAAETPEEVSNNGSLFAPDEIEEVKKAEGRTQRKYSGRKERAEKKIKEETPKELKGPRNGIWTKFHGKINSLFEEMENEEI